MWRMATFDETNPIAVGAARGAGVRTPSESSAYHRSRGAVRAVDYCGAANAPPATNAAMPQPDQGMPARSHQLLLNNPHIRSRASQPKCSRICYLR